MNKILVIGASGFVGKRLVKALLADDCEVRCLARNLAKVQDLAQAGCEIVQGDMGDEDSIQRALQSVEAVYISIHTLSPQPMSKPDQGFMEIEMEGLRNIVAACRLNGVRRVIYLTFLGATPDSPSAWVRGRWEAEQLLIKSGLDVTVIRPGQIVGVGGHGFNMMVGQAKKSTTLVLGGAIQYHRNIALDDLVYYLVGVRMDPRAYGQCYNVGCDDVLTMDQMIDTAADVLGRPHPRKLHVSPKLLSLMAPLIERLAKLPKGAIRGLADGMRSDMNGDPMPIRQLLPRHPLSYRQAVEKALGT